MICEHYRRVVEQVRSRLGKQEQNIVMVHYGDDFSIVPLEGMFCVSEDQNPVFDIWHEYQYYELPGGYEPFLDIIWRAFRMFGDGDFSGFLEQSGVYVPHREVLESYYRDGLCTRREMVLLDEVRYEQERMTKAICQMLLKTARYCPVLIVLNRFQLASRSTLELVRELLGHPCANIGVVLGVNEKPGQDESVLKCWEEITELLADSGHIYHIGSGDRERKSIGETENWMLRRFDDLYRKINNTAQLLDYDQAFLLFQEVVHRGRFGGEVIREDQKLQLYPLYARVAIGRGDFATALEAVHALRRLQIPGQEARITYFSEYYLAMCLCIRASLAKAICMPRRRPMRQNRRGANN